MKSQKRHLQSFTVSLFLICNTVFEVHSSSSFRPYYEPRTFTGALNFLSSSTYYIRGKTLNCNANLSKSFEKIHHVVVSSERPATSRRWHVGRVSRKQYEIVNMLWRRTNVFVDEYITTPAPITQLQTQQRELRGMNTICEMCRIASKLQSNKHNVLTTSRPTVQSTTASYIEFYYLVEMDNETDPSVGEQLSIPNKHKNVAPTKNNTKFNARIQHVPYFTFHNIGPILKAPTIKKSQTHFSKNNSSEKQSGVPDFTKKIGKRTTFNAENKTSNINNICKEEKCGLRSDTASYYSINERKPHILNTTSWNNKSATTSSVTPTSNDKIKFFELYDDNTEGTPKRNWIVDPDIENDIVNEKKNELHDIDNELGNQSSMKTKTIKKHIEATDIRNNFDEIIFKAKSNYVKTNAVPTTNAKENFIHDKYEVQKANTSNIPNARRQSEIFVKASRAASWSEYPFAAVYVYERFQVHCDAAVISPHWVLASASCLSRHREDPAGDSRTAFVTYCGECWWNPDRINYVKYSLMHPRFNPRDRVRRHLYNVGLVQVVTSMASACNNWAPVTLISHQFVADKEGSMASAVGWGLDRYDTSYTSSDLPRRRLSVYDGMVFSDTCPGNIGYRRAKHRNEEGINNVYCLSLPPYLGEQDDPSHGGLLLVGGKLIALYLQEERREWGDQSAQYTGIWRLVPWIMEVAKEPDEIDFMM